jgi:hypothetical protein
LSNHAVEHGGEFIPSGFRIWAEAYQDHPVFILDLLHNESHDYDPGIDVDSAFAQQISYDFLQQYDLQETVFKANQFNKLFTMLDRFDDLKLTKLAETTPITVNLNQFNIERDINVTIPAGLLANTESPMIVLKWQAFYKDVVLSSDQCWFGNVAKSIHSKYRTGADIVFRYDPEHRCWRLSY